VTIHWTNHIECNVAVPYLKVEKLFLENCGLIYKENWSIIAEHPGFLKDFLESEAMLISKFLLNRTYNLYHWKVYHQIKTNIETHVMSLVEINSNSQARIIEAEICESKQQSVMPDRRNQMIIEKPEIPTATKSAKQSKKIYYNQH
jgi:hypothetical protein